MRVLRTNQNVCLHDWQISRWQGCPKASGGKHQPGASKLRVAR
ncbi:hypothetical protein EV679_1286 [Kerstersia gyiorum]|uniref:Uncharacterized protein n=1 Tax=Kerstersia gyiorum TaxID=206506 RepID=A0A4Q7MNW8_9BURK|nr:hypothetical protein [Kerstersia gyiorum]MCP1637616.1 hypothetical protein [Kerstersia gyiorum]MCP1670678.1 hypothetical protein [Kerstersia gyiorum]MCP1678667.1 hypothetical protein [Kerstersia gyiorum]MCP1683330.1 hypothetical protein [Kerstersia gyiorum]